MKILFVTSEAAPFAKTGGLADVAGSLPLTLRRLGHDIRVILPSYQSIEEKGYSVRKGRKSVEVTIDGAAQKGLLRQSSIDGLPFFFIENRNYFNREGLYGTEEGDYPDNAQRFGFFCRAVLALLRRMDFRPDVLHLNDWQTGLIPVLLKTEFRDDPFYSSMGTLMTIHNLGYQGIFPPSALSSLGLSPTLMSVEGLEYFGDISFLKGGVLYSDLLSTVSETYCREIQTPEMGFGFDGLLSRRSRNLFGILNGLDDKLWDPGLDSALVSPYGASDLRGKNTNKKMLQKELGLQTSSGIPIVSMVTRLDTQKGLGLLEEAWEELMHRDLQMVILGTGQRKHMEFFAGMQDRFPGKVSINLAFDESLARRIYAGSDLFLMPSLYEPCGLGQLIALRYGALPLVRRTGGLADTVTDPEENSQNANGFSFKKASGAALIQALDRALVQFKDRRAWLKMVRRGMNQDFSWTRSAQRYLEIYRKTMEVRNV